MAVKKYKPTSAARRFITTADFSELTKKAPEKSLLEVKKKHSGRNNNGHITTRHKGGGYRKQYRIVDFKRTKDGIPAKVAAIEYDPNRTARLALLHYRGGEARSTSGRPPTTPWGQMTMGKKTRRTKRTTKMIVRKRKSK